MTQEQKRDYRKEIEDLLSNYEDGWQIFTKAADWSEPIRFKPDAKGHNLPDTWLGVADRVISIIAHGKYGLDTYPNTIWVITAEQMLDAYSSVGMPVNYDHWSIGKQRVQEGKNYNAGRSGLAYEIVINSSPSIAYCMTSNTTLMQMLVIAHASYGHNSFFKGNHLFRQFTNAETIIDELEHLRDSIKRYEDLHGIDEVEALLDAAHALENLGVNRYTKPKRRTPQEEAKRRAELEEIRLQNVNHVMDTVRGKPAPVEDFNKSSSNVTIPPDLEENLLKFVASYAPHLKEWERDLLRQLSDKAQYFYPQRQTQVMNEGWASFWHYTLLNDLYDLDLINDKMMLEFIDSHAGVLFQPDHDSRYYSGRFNPYALGFAIYQDIKRICENPTEEDRRWFPDLVGKEWLPTLKEAMQDYKDESFILQYLSPKVMRDFHMFAVHDDENDDEIEISAIHDDDAGYKEVRRVLASQYRLGDIEPCIEVAGYDYQDTRMLTLRHKMFNNKPLAEDNTTRVLKHLHYLWKHPVAIHSVDEDDTVVDTLAVPRDAKNQGPDIGEKMRYTMHLGM